MPIADQCKGKPSTGLSEGAEAEKIDLGQYLPNTDLPYIDNRGVGVYPFRRRMTRGSEHLKFSQIIIKIRDP